MVGVEVHKQETAPIFWFIKDPNQTGYDDKNKALAFDDNSALSPFAKSIGFKITDQVLALDGKAIDIQKIQDFIGYTKTIKDGQDVTVTILRDNAGKKEKMTLKGKAILDKLSMETLQFKANPSPEELKLQNQWLTGKNNRKEAVFETASFYAINKAQYRSYKVLAEANGLGIKLKDRLKPVPMNVLQILSIDK